MRGAKTGCLLLQAGQPVLVDLPFEGQGLQQADGMAILGALREAVNPARLAAGFTPTGGSPAAPDGGDPGFGQPPPTRRAAAQDPFGAPAAPFGQPPPTRRAAAQDPFVASGGGDHFDWPAVEPAGGFGQPPPTM